MSDVKFTLYLKKAGLASRNIVHLPVKSLYVVSVSAFILQAELQYEMDHKISNSFRNSLLGSALMWIPFVIQNAWSLIQWKNTADPDPGVVIPDPGAVIPRIPPFLGLWSLIPYTLLRPSL